MPDETCVPNLTCSTPVAVRCQRLVALALYESVESGAPAPRPARPVLAAQKPALRCRITASSIMVSPSE